MKKIIAFTFILAVAGFSVSAQERREMKGNKQGMHKMHGQKADMMKDINLTDAQKTQMKTDREIYKAKMEALRKEENITVKELKARQNAIHNEQRAKMQALLTPEQKTKIAAEKATMKNKRKDMDAQHEAEMKEKLGLSNDQAAKLKAFNKETHNKIKAIHENESLSISQKKEQMKAVKEASKDQRKSILTAEQRKKMEEMKKEGSHIKGNKGTKTAK